MRAIDIPATLRWRRTRACHRVIERTAECVERRKPAASVWGIDFANFSELPSEPFLPSPSFDNGLLIVETTEHSAAQRAMQAVAKILRAKAAARARDEFLQEQVDAAAEHAPGAATAHPVGAPGMQQQQQLILSQQQQQDPNAPRRSDGGPDAGPSSPPQAGPLALPLPLPPPPPHASSPHHQTPHQLRYFLPHLNLHSRYHDPRAVESCSGYLWKRGHKMKVWRKRWFSVERECLVYRTHEDSPKIKGTIPLLAVRNIFRTDNVRSKARYNNSCICIRTDWRTYVVIADTTQEAWRWNLFLFHAWRTCVEGARTDAKKREEEAIAQAEDDGKELKAAQTYAKWMGAVSGVRRAALGAGGAAPFAVSGVSDLPTTRAGWYQAQRPAWLRRMWRLAICAVVAENKLKFQREVTAIFKDQTGAISKARHGEISLRGEASAALQSLQGQVVELSGALKREQAARAETHARGRAALEASGREAGTLARRVAAMQAEASDREAHVAFLEKSIASYEKQLREYYAWARKVAPQTAAAANAPARVSQLT